MARRAVRRAPELSRGEILDAALRCFAARGYHDTSIDDIALAAGLSKGAIYWHFANKRELFLAIVDRFADRSLPLLDRVAEAPDWPAAVREVFEQARRHAEESLPFFTLGLEYMAQTGRDPELRKRVERGQEKWQAAVRAQLARGVAEGRLARGAPESIALLLDATVDGLMLAKLMRPDVDLEAAFAAAEALFARGVGT